MTTDKASASSAPGGMFDARAELAELYRDLHAHPELSGQEQRTAAAAAAHLERAGFDVTTGVGGAGVVGVLRTDMGPTVMLRADMARIQRSTSDGRARDWGAIWSVECSIVSGRAARP